MGEAEMIRTILEKKKLPGHLWMGNTTDDTCSAAFIPALPLWRCHPFTDHWRTQDARERIFNSFGDGNRKPETVPLLTIERSK